MIDSTQEEVDARKEASEKPFERACTNCGNGEYSEGIDFDEVTFCRSCCEKAGVGEKTEPSKNNGARNIVVHALTDKEGRASIESQYKLAKKEGRLKIKEKQ